jgi:hypothetical protein
MVASRSPDWPNAGSHVVGSLNYWATLRQLDSEFNRGRLVSRRPWSPSCSRYSCELSQLTSVPGRARRWPGLVDSAASGLDEQWILAMAFSPRAGPDRPIPAGRSAGSLEHAYPFNSFNLDSATMTAGSQPTRNRPGPSESRSLATWAPRPDTESPRAR